jgi:glycosyltransferase involved in cell wall biosynthesis
MRSRPAVLFVTGAYAPEFSAGGLQCQAVARALGGRASVEVLTTSTTRTLSHRDEIEGVPVTRVHVELGRRWSALQSSATMAVALLRLLPRIDLVHVQGVSSKNVLLTALARLFSRPVIVHLQTAKHDEPEAIRAQGSLAWWAFSSADRYIAVSRGLAQRYLDAGLPANRIQEIPNGVDLARFHPASGSERRELRRQLGLAPERPLILFVGVMSPDKQPHVLMEAWAQLQGREGSDSTLVFVGATDPRLFELGGRLVEELRQTVDRIGGDGRVHFVPPTSEIERYYRAADVVVMPSLREGLPNVILEAMACGLPVVASRLPGSTETMIADGVNGRLVAPGDTAGFAAAIGELLRDPGLADRLGRAARHTAEDRYRIEHVADQWLAAYDEALPGRHGGAPQ